MGFMDGLAQGYGQGSQLGVSMYKDMQADDLRRAALAQADAEKKATWEREDAQRKAALDRQLANDAYSKSQDERNYQLKLKELNMKNSGTNPASMPMTPGRKAADMAFGKEYVDFNTGGLATVDKGINTLETAKQELIDNGKNLTGPIRGAMPDFIRAFTNPEAVAVKERIRGAVQSTLKQTLGAQFTEKEGERIFNNAYNDRLSPEENVKRLDSIMAELKSQKEAKQNMGQYFENTGTLTGYKQPQQPQKRYQIIGVE